MGEHMHSWKWVDATGAMTPYEFCLGCGLRRTKYPFETNLGRRMVNDLHDDPHGPHVHRGRWCPTCLVLAHDLRTYARHESGCAFQGASGPTCDCGFDELLERYDRLSAE